MKRVVVLSQPGAFGSISCLRVASRLAARLELPCIAASEDGLAGPGGAAGWVATAAVGTVSRALLHAADTVIWLHYSPAAISQAWSRGLRTKLAHTTFAGRAPRLSDIRDSLLHMIRTPQLHQLLCQSEFAHLHVFLLRNPDQTDFWLRAQEQRLPRRRQVAMPQAA